MAKKIFNADIDLNGNQLLNGIHQNLAVRPTGKAGQIIFNTSLNVFEGYDGTSWSELGAGGLASVPIATDTVLGGVMVPTGSDISIDALGNINLNAVVKTVINGAIQRVKVNGTVVTPDGTNTVDLDVPTLTSGKIDPMFLPLEFIRDTHIVATFSALPNPPATDQETDFFIVVDENTTYYWNGTSWTATARPVEYATQTEAVAGVMTNKAMSPATTKAAIDDALDGAAKKYTATLGDGTATSFSVSHGLDNKYPTYTAYIDDIETEINYTPLTNNTGTLTMNTPPATGTLAVTFIG